MEFIKNHKTNLLLLIVLSIVIILPGISSMPLFDPDEPVYALTPHEMITSGDWLSPQIYGKYWYDKPPLLYWLVAGCYKLFGYNEFSTRFPSAFFGIVSVLMLYCFINKIINKRSALLSALVLLTSMEYFYLCKAAVIDIVLLFCMSAALLSYWSGKYFWLYVFAALAVLAKGPVGFLLPGAIIFVDILINNRWREMKKMRLFTGIPVFLLIALPWYLAMWKVHGQAFVDGFLGLNNVTRFLSPEHPGGEKLWWFVPVLLIGMFPWTGVLLQSVYATAKEAILKWRSGKKENPLLFAHIWAWVIFIFFSVSQTKLVTYILPMFPAMAVIIGYYLSKSSEKLGCKTKVAMTLIAVLFSLLLAVAAVAGQALLQSGVFARNDIGTPEIIAALQAQLANPLALWQSIFVAVVTLALFGFSNYKLWHGGVLSGLKWQTGALVVFTLLLVYVYVPVGYGWFDSRSFSQEFFKAYDGVSPVYITKYRHPGFTFYTGINGIEIAGQKETEEKILANAGNKAYFIVFDSQYNDFPESVRKVVKVEKISCEKYLLRTK